MLLSRHHVKGILSVIFLLQVSGCQQIENPFSQTIHNIDTTQLIQTSRSEHEISNHHLWGFWQVSINPDSLDSEVVPVRMPAIHVNIRKFLEDGQPCSTCFEIKKIIDTTSELHVYIAVKHPWPGLDKYTGFDVRGIAMWNGTKVWPSSGLRSQDPNGTDDWVIEPDGYTTLFNPTDFPPGSNIPLFTYSKGKFASNTLPNSTLNPYLNYYTDEYRHFFRAGQEVTRCWRIKKPLSKPLVLGYAIDACWEPPTVDPPKSIPADFPIEANRPEPYRVNASLANQLKPIKGAKASVFVDALDWDPKNLPKDAWIECPDLWSGIVHAWEASPISGGVRFTVDIVNETGAGNGFYSALVGVVDKNVSQPSWDSTEYQLYKIEVSSIDCCKEPPLALIKDPPMHVLTGEQVTLISESFDPDSPECQVYASWDLNNDGIFELQGNEVITSWDSTGNYLVMLKAEDECQQTDVMGLGIKVHVGVTQPEDKLYKNPGTKYIHLSADLSPADAAWAVNVNDLDGPWDFTKLPLNDMGNYRAVIPKNHPEVLPFIGDFNAEFDHFYKTSGIFHNVKGELYVAEVYEPDPDRLCWIGVHEGAEMGSVNFLPAIKIPFPFWIFSDYHYEKSMPPLFTLKFDWRGWAEGIVTVPIKGGLTEPCVVMKYEGKIITEDFNGSALVYEWFLDNGISVAFVVAINKDGDNNYDPLTGEITGIATYNALVDIIPY